MAQDDDTVGATYYVDENGVRVTNAWNLLFEDSLLHYEVIILPIMEIWRRSNDNYYYLDEDGVMAKDALIKDDTVNATYYVDENGVRLTNTYFL